MSETFRESAMAIVPFQELQPYSSPPKLNMEKPTKEKEKPSCLKQITNVVHANPNMKSESYKHKKYKVAPVDSLYDTSEAQLSVMKRAKKVEANLAPEFPSVIKVMRPSNVTKSFCLSLPKNFCCDHLPKLDTMIVLEDENGREYQTKYLVGKGGLSGGWRGFSIAHKLVAGDVLVFHLVTSSKFKVYIVTANGVVADKQLLVGYFKNYVVALLNGLTVTDPFFYHFNDLNHPARITACESARNENVQPISVAAPRENIQKENNTRCCALLDQSGKGSEDIGYEGLDGIKLSESVVPFEEVKCMENFDVVINGLVLNSEFTKYLLSKYYELCCSQNSYLHENILEGLNYKLVAGIISETINIADALRACKITTSECSFSIWDKTLQASEILGMNVGFLRARLNKLATLASKSKRCEEATLEADQVEVEFKPLNERETTNKHDPESDTDNVCFERLEAMFQEVAKAPW